MSLFRAVVMVSVVLLFAASTALKGEEKTWTPEQFIVESGFDKVLGSFGRGVKQVINSPELNSAISAAQLRQVWPQAVDGTLAQPILEKAMANQLNGVFEAGEMRGIQEFLTSDFGRRITALENKSAGIAQEQKQELAAPILENMSAQRAKKLRVLIENVGGVEVGLAMTLNSTFAMVKGMQAAGNIPMQLSDTHLLQQLRKQEPKMREQIMLHMMIAAVYTYRDVSDADLDTYNEFLSSKSGAAMYEKSMQALDAVLAQAMGHFGTKLMVLMGHKKA